MRHKEYIPFDLSESIEGISRFDWTPKQCDIYRDWFMESMDERIDVLLHARKSREES